MTFLIFIFLFLGGLVLGYFVRDFLSKKKISSLEKQTEENLAEKRKEAERILNEAREKSLNIVEESKKERERILSDILEREKRISQRETFLDEKEFTLLEKEKFLLNKANDIENREKIIIDKEKFLEESLEKISNLSKEEAFRMLIERIEKENENELLEIITRHQKRIKDTVEEESRKILVENLPRYSRSVVSEITTTTISLPNEEMKGRIIGKEGRNIKHFENLSGVQLIIDETPEIVILSSFDPVRREIARIALEKLIKDERIHPATIEEKIKEAKDEIEKIIEEAGKNASYEVGLFDLPPEVMILMGRLKFRYSYGQNALLHSIEVATFSKIIAEELGFDSYVAKKAGFLHDIGKSVTHEFEGNHLEIGIKILERYNIEEKVILAMRSHHETYPFAIPEAFIVLTADSISGHRLGARRETTEIYLQRLQDLEKISTSFPGVEKAYAISGGREIRVFVNAEEVSDVELYKLAKEIAQKIEKEVKYPGEIKVVAIRENRAVEYAK